MKRFLIVVLVFVSVVLNGCEPCDSIRYQIREKKNIDSNLCEYKAMSMGECLIWKDQTVITFLDSCKEYSLSQVIEKDYIVKKYK